MAVQLTLSVLLIALLTGRIFCLPFGLYKPDTQGSSPAPVRSNVRERVHGLQGPQTSQNSPSARSQPADDPTVNMAEDPSTSPQPEGGMLYNPIMYPPPVPPGNQFQAGELYQIEESQDFGNFLLESNEKNPVVAPPNGGPIFPPIVPSYNDGLAYDNPYGPNRDFVGTWISIPFDYQFLNGHYPKGTFSYQSSSFGHGEDHYNGDHYTNLPSVSSIRYPSLPNRMWFMPGYNQGSRPAHRAIGSIHWL